MENEALQSGSVVIGLLAIITLLVREGFSYLKYKKNGGSDSLNREIFDELKLMNNNHLHSIEKAINDGNADIVRAINDGNRQTVELLGEIKGNLNARR